MIRARTASRIAMLFVLAAPAMAQVLAQPVPLEAQAVVDEASRAAAARDMSALRQLMAEGFKWNLGPDGEDVGAAIEAWSRDPMYLTQMRAVLQRGCHLYDADNVHCPGQGGMNFRAGFTRTASGWRLTHFLAGD